MESWIMTLIEGAGYVGIFLAMLAETLFPPIPSEVIMPLAGVAAAKGKLDLSLVVFAGVAGSMAGNVFWFLLARAFGLSRLRLLIRKYGNWLALSWSDVVRINHVFRRFGGPIVLIGRVLPTIRTLISIPAGAARMSMQSFFVWSALGTSVWSSGLTVAGWMLGRNIARIEEILAPLATFVLGAMLAAYAAKQITYRRMRNRNRDPENSVGL